MVVTGSVIRSAETHRLSSLRTDVNTPGQNRAGVTHDLQQAP